MENNMISEKIVNGVKVHFNHDHYMDVRKVHELKNKIVINAEWNHYYHEGNKIIEHPLLYKIIRDKETKTLYIVTKVLRQFFEGFEGAVNAFGERPNEWFYYHVENNEKVLKHFKECE